MAKMRDEVSLRSQQVGGKKKRDVVGIGITLTEEEEMILKEEAGKHYLTLMAYIRKITSDFIRETRLEEAKENSGV